MNFTRKILAGSSAITILAAALAPVAQAEVSGSVGVASTYLWRGMDLGSGTPAVFGDLSYSNSGFYSGIWGSSGDTAAGSEYDLYAGYGSTLGDFSYDLSLWSYNYPTGPDETDFTDVSDAVVSVGYGPVAFSAYIPIGKDNSGSDYMYYTLSGSLNQFSATLGLHQDDPDAVVGCPADNTGDTCSPMHIDVSYAYNDNLAFTLSQMIADEPEGDDLKFIVSYSLPIGE